MSGYAYPYTIKDIKGKKVFIRAKKRFIRAIINLSRVDSTLECDQSMQPSRSLSRVFSPSEVYAKFSIDFGWSAVHWQRWLPLVAMSGPGYPAVYTEMIICFINAFL